MAHEAIRPLLGDAYNFDSTPILRALWRSFTQCIFVEEHGDVLFYKNNDGVAKRQTKGGENLGKASISPAKGN